MMPDMCTNTHTSQPAHELFSALTYGRRATNVAAARRPADQMDIHHITSHTGKRRPPFCPQP